MNKQKWIVGACCACACWMPSAAVAAENEPDLPMVAAIRVAVTNLEQSLAFYSTQLGCRMTHDGRAEGYLVLDNHGTSIVLTRTEVPIEIGEGQCHVRVNFKITDLDAWVSKAKKSGVDLLGESKSAVGRYVSFHDPSGNRHNMKQLSHETAQLDEPHVYDVGIAVTDMNRGRKFYGDLLGFEVMTEKFYPPVVPFTQRGCAFFILSEEKASKPSPYRYGKTGWTGLALEVRDISKVMKHLREKGLTFIDSEPIYKGPVLCAAFSDPFGNIHELIQHVPPATQDYANAGRAYYCPPCPSNCHDRIHDEPGRCPTCTRNLVEMEHPRNVAILIWDGVEVLDFTGPAEVFAAARAGDTGAFNVFTVAVSPEPITSQGFLKVTPNYTIDNCPPPHVLVIPGGNSRTVVQNEKLVEWVKRTSTQTDMILSVCTGAFVLAKAGLLDEIDATTWHGAIDNLRREAPRARVHTNRRYVDSGDIITAAGVSAGIDGALHALARLTGPDVAARTARYMEYDYWPDVDGKSHMQRLHEQIASDPEAVLSDLDVQLRAGTRTGNALISDPAYFPLHENPRFRELIRQSARGSTATLVTPDEPGGRLAVSGTIRDEEGKPVRGALVYVFHTNAQGSYSSSGGNVGSMGDSLNPRLFAYLRTDAEGRYQGNRILKPARP